jgi:RsiW-degrading membrane proteinase PrsW (M82 family)
MRYLWRDERMQLGPINRNTLYLIVGALAVVVVVLAYQLYQDRKEPQGMQINVGPGGISIEKK